MANEAVYQSLEWMVVRKHAIERDGHACVNCGGTSASRTLEVDHVVPLSAGGAPFDLSNLRTLCRHCHTRRHHG